MRVSKLVRMALLTMSETEAELRLSRRHVSTLTLTGELPSVRIGRRRLVRREDLDRFIEARVEGAPVGAAGSDQLPAAREGRRARVNRSVRA